jgi:hypothetical protein
MSYFIVATVPKQLSGGTVNPSDPTVAAFTALPAPSAATIVASAHFVFIVLAVVARMVVVVVVGGDGQCRLEYS